MAKKDLVINLQDDYSNPVSAKGKTAILMDNVTKDDIAKFTFKIIDNNLVITSENGSKGLKLSDYANIASIKYDYIKEGNRESYRVVDLIKNNLIDNTANHISSYKKNSITGVTDFNDYIDASASGYINLKNNKGLTINGKKGSDTIIGTQYNDTITGGLGKNKIIYNSEKFGVDTIKLTKGEELEILFKDDLSLGEGDSLNFAMAKNKKDLEVTNSLSDKDSKIILKNYYAKDTGVNVIIGGYNLAEQTLLPEVTAKNYFEAAKKVKTSYTGSALADRINAAGLTKATNVKKGTGITINGGAGNDVITGSDYNDTIKAGAGNDTITGGAGNDKLYAVSGDNTFVFHSGDKTDIFYSGKGEDSLQFYGISLNNISKKLVAKDLVLTYGDGDSVTLKNYIDKKGNVISSAKKIITKEGEFNLVDFVNGDVTPPVPEETTITIDNQTTDLSLVAGKDYNINSISSGVTLTLNSGTTENLIISRSGNDILVKNGEDTITLKGLANNNSQITFKDSTNATLSVCTGYNNINGTSKDDIIFNSTGNDTLVGNGGTNTYVFKKGDGTDHVSSTSGSDIIRFIDVNLSEIKPSTEDDKLYLKYSDNDRVYIDDFFKNQKDITVYTADKQYFSLKEDLGFIIGSGTINGDTKGNIIAGSNGNDTITAGKGDDKIIEYSGKNTYVFNKGDGDDRIYALGTDSHEDILKFNNSVMSDLKLFRTTSGGLMINYNGGDSTDKNNLVTINNYGSAQNKVTKFMLKDDNTVYSIEDHYVNYITSKYDTDEHGYNRYVGTDFNDEFMTNTSSTEIYSGKEGKNIYNFQSGCGVDYVLSTSGKDTVNLKNIDLSTLSVSINSSNVSLSYGEGNDRIIFQNYMDDEINIKIVGKNNQETTLKACVDSHLSSLSAPNTFLFDELNASVVQWTSINDGVVQTDSSNLSFVDNTDMIAVFTGK